MISIYYIVLADLLTININLTLTLKSSSFMYTVKKPADIVWRKKS